MHSDASFLRAWAAAPGPALANDETGEGIGSERRRYRTVWISDLHLGTPGCQAAALLDFLKHVDCETLFLVGDIIDGWQLRRSWYWPQSHNDVVQKLLRKAREGTRVIFIPGNHDELRGATCSTTSAAWTWPRTGSTRRPTAAACGWCTATCSTA